MYLDVFFLRYRFTLHTEIPSHVIIVSEQIDDLRMLSSQRRCLKFWDIRHFLKRNLGPSRYWHNLISRTNLHQNVFLRNGLISRLYFRIRGAVVISIWRNNYSLKKSPTSTSLYTPPPPCFDSGKRVNAGDNLRYDRRFYSKCLDLRNINNVRNNVNKVYQLIIMWSRILWFQNKEIVCLLPVILLN